MAVAAIADTKDVFDSVKASGVADAGEDRHAEPRAVAAHRSARPRLTVSQTIRNAGDTVAVNFGPYFVGLSNDDTVVGTNRDHRRREPESSGVLTAICTLA